MPMEDPRRSIVAQLAHSDEDKQVSNSHGIPDEIKNSDKEVIEKAVRTCKDYVGAISINAVLFMTINGVRAYRLQIAYNQPQQGAGQPGGLPGGANPATEKAGPSEGYCFVYSEATPAVLEYLVSAAQANQFKSILAFTEHAIVVSHYKIG